MYRGTTLFPTTGTYLMRNEHESSWNTVTSSKQLRWEIQPPVSLQSSFQPMTASLLGEYEYLLTPSLPLNMPILLIFFKKVNRQRSFYSFLLLSKTFSDVHAQRNYHDKPDNRLCDNNPKVAYLRCQKVCN